ncbi:ROK family protein [Candidatus Mycoplasma pogonae]
MQKMLVFDIGGTHIKYGIVDENNNFLLRNHIKTDIGNVINDIAKIIQDLLAKENQKHNFSGIAIATTGAVDNVAKKIVFANHRMAHYLYTDFNVLSQMFNLPLVVENDANAAAMSERVFREGIDNYATVTLGTGVGIGIVKNHNLATGHNFMGGEYGYLKYEGEFLDDYLSFSRLTNYINENYGLTISDYEKFDNLYHNDLSFKTVIDKYFQKIVDFTYQLAIFQNLDYIFLSGGFSYVDPKYFAMIQEKFNAAIAKTPYKTQLKISKSRNNAGMLGALYLLKRVM